jgi:hypothetical protein
MEYKIVSHKDSKDTEDEVNAFLNEGWELHGDLKVIGGTPNAYAQAMTRQEHYPQIDSSVLVTVDELDGVKYAIESIGEGLQAVATALGGIGTSLSDKPAEEKAEG